MVNLKNLFIKVKLKKFISSNYYIFKLNLKHDTIDSIEMR